MNKSLTYLLLFLLPLTGTAQSAKKLNKQLKAAYTARYHEADSVGQLHKKELALWQLTKNAFYDTIDRFRALDKQYYVLQDSVNSKGNNLEKLGRIPGPYVKDIQVFYRARYRFEYLISPFFERLGFLDVVLGAGISLDSIRDLSEYDIDSQNKHLQQALESIDRFFTAVGYDRDKIAKSLVGMDTTQTQLTAIKRTLSEMVPTLRSYNATLEKELAAEKQLFAKKGPKGFDEAWFEVFPDVFPKKPEPLIEHSEYNIKAYETVYEREPGDVEGLPVESAENQVYDVPDEPARFPGGPEEMKKFIKNNLEMPEIAENLGLEGMTVLKFIVEIDGSISGIELVRGMAGCGECDEEAIRLVKIMPNWTPGNVKGKPAKSYFYFPVKFKVES